MSGDQPFWRGLVLDGRYRLESPLGEGGMGTVWVGQQITLGRAVAIKSLKGGRSDDGPRLEREARLLAAVRHPSIVQVFDFGRTENGLPYVVMELVHGPSLSSHLHASGTMNAEEAVSLLLPVLDGLAAVHAAGIVHRDIKPANIVLASEDGPDAPRIVPKLLDFGIARDDAGTDLTRQGDLLGTPDYMAPEQFLGLRPDARADLWAVAATLFDMMTGEPPFVGSTLFDLMRRVKEEPPGFPRSARGLDGSLWRLMTQALRKSPDERPANAIVFRRDLSLWLAARGGPRELALPSLGGSRGPSGRSEQHHSTQSATASASESADTFDTLIKTRFGV